MERSTEFVRARIADDGRKLFLGDYDRGIFVGNICTAIDGTGNVTGELADKCQAVAPRAMHYLSGRDGAILYQQPSSLYRDYCETLYGCRPEIFTPEQVDINPLNLIRDILEDTALVRHLATEGKRREWRLVPFIMHPDVHLLAKETGLPVIGSGEELVRNGLVARLNNKAVFKEICREIGIPTAPSLHVCGVKDLIRAAEEVCREYGAVMLRQASGAAGLGNRTITRDEMLAIATTTIKGYLDAEIFKDTDHPAWKMDTVLVEPLLNIVHSPAALCYIDDGGHVNFLTDSLQILEGSSFTGTRLPSGLNPSMEDYIRRYTIRYAEYAAKLGARGHINVDWMLTRDQELVACESNYRFTGVVHPLMIRDRLCHDEPMVVMSNDALHYEGELPLEKVLAYLDLMKIGWNQELGEGIVVSIPPHGGSMGFVSLAKKVSRAQTMYDEMLDLAHVHN